MITIIQGTGVRMMTPEQHTHHRSSTVRNARNDLAALLSLVPGLGHWYKGYRLMGLGILVVGLPLVFFVAGIMALATFGLSLFLPLLFWAFTAWHAYEIRDHNRHHWFM